MRWWRNGIRSAFKMRGLRSCGFKSHPSYKHFGILSTMSICIGMSNIDKEEFVKVCSESPTMSTAAAKLGLHFNTFKKLAIELGCYVPNQGGKGTKKNGNESRTVPLEEILAGLHPHFQTHKLKNKLLKSGTVTNECLVCGISSWQGKKLTCELDHINGDRTDHRLENLRILCPNCHSQTETFRSKNRKKT